MRTRLKSLGLLLCGVVLFGMNAARAAETKVVLQISDDSPATQTLVLNVAGNLIDAFGPDHIKLEVVAFGPGLKLLFANNKNRDRIQSLSTYGVRFDACQNTLAAMTKQLGHKPKLDAESIPVPQGVVQIVRLNQAGYTVIRP